MKRSLVVVMVVVTAMTAVVTGRAQQQSAAYSAVQALLEQHNQAMSEHNLNGVMAVWASNPNIVLMGTGPGEYYAGKQDIQDAYKNFLERFDPGTMKVEYIRMVADENGDTA